MSIKKDSGRQDVSAAIVNFSHSDFGASGVAEAAVEMPAGASVCGGFLAIEEAFNSGTSDSLKVGDAGNDARYANGVNGQVVGATGLTAAGVKFTSQGNVTLTWTGAGAAPTAGKGRLCILYVIDGRADYSQG